MIPKIYDSLVTPNRIAITTNMSVEMTEEVFEGYVVCAKGYSKMYNQPIYALKKESKR